MYIASIILSLSSALSRGVGASQISIISIIIIITKPPRTKQAADHSLCSGLPVVLENDDVGEIHRPPVSLGVGMQRGRLAQLHEGIVLLLQTSVRCAVHES